MLYIKKYQGKIFCLQKIVQLNFSSNKMLRFNGYTARVSFFFKRGRNSNKLLK